MYIYIYIDTYIIRRTTRRTDKGRTGGERTEDGRRRRDGHEGDDVTRREGKTVALSPLGLRLHCAPTAWYTMGAIMHRCFHLIFQKIPVLSYSR